MSITDLERSAVLSFSDLTNLISRVTYKPGWSLTVEDHWHDHELPTLRVQADMQDSSAPSWSVRRIHLDIASPIPPSSTEHEVLAWLAWRIQEIEKHEAQEHLKLDGLPVEDPHRRTPAFIDLSSAGMYELGKAMVDQHRAGK